MSHIQNTDNTPEYRHGYIFLLKYVEDGPRVDVWLDVADVLGIEWVSLMAAEKLTGVENKELRAIVDRVAMIKLRTRVDLSTYGPYLVRTEVPISAKDIEEFLRSLTYARRKAFLSGAEI